jgi:hypothetical protein
VDTDFFLIDPVISNAQPQSETSSPGPQFEIIPDWIHPSATSLESKINFGALPSPPQSTSESPPELSESVRAESIPRGRRRGRPKIVDSTRSDLRHIARREMHNNSAMRSRARLNTMIDELWESIPASFRQSLKSHIGNCEGGRPVHRAGKLEVALLYLRKVECHGGYIDKVL